jgi:predicted acetyltransferase
MMPVDVGFPVMTVTVTRALREHEPIIQNLAQLYTHDFSDFWVDTPRGDLLPDGRFEEYPMQEYWTHPNWSASLIRRDGVLAGFALINDRTHSGEAADRNVGEFFILRKHRGRGVGRLAASALFSLHPGLWEVAVARKNTQALEFWRKTITGAAEASAVNLSDHADHHWNGSIFRFNWRSRELGNS